MNCHHNRQRSTRCILDRFLPISSFQMLADLSIHTQTWAVPPATLHLAASVTTRIGLTQFLFETVAHLHRCFLFFYGRKRKEKKTPSWRLKPGVSVWEPWSPSGEPLFLSLCLSRRWGSESDSTRFTERPQSLQLASFSQAEGETESQLGRYSGCQLLNGIGLERFVFFKLFAVDSRTAHYVFL